MSLFYYLLNHIFKELKFDFYYRKDFGDKFKYKFKMIYYFRNFTLGKNSILTTVESYRCSNY